MIRALGSAILLCTTIAACGDSERPQEGEPEPVWVDDILSEADRVRWPGIDTDEGRVIPLISGFGRGRPASYWFVGFGTRETTDAFWFCREGDLLCPLDAHRRLNWDRFIGNPLLSRVPGDPRYSDFWQMWTVVVGEDFEPDSIRTVGQLFDAVGRREVRVDRTVVDFGTMGGVEIGLRDAIMQFPVVLRGTRLEGNGGPMRDGSGNRLRLKRHVAWRQGLLVEFIDFSPAEGVFPAADDSAERPRMPFANIYIYWRACDAEPRPSICALPGTDPTRRPVSERGLGQDLSGDGDTNDTNNVVGALPCDPSPDSEEPPYSPLWAVSAVDVLPDAVLTLIDTSGDQAISDIQSASDMWLAVTAGVLGEPRPESLLAAGLDPHAEPQQLFFNCPSPVAEDHIPFPCAGE